MGLARKSIITRHPSGITIRTPLLIPSFSSKGFRLEKRRKGTKHKYLFRPSTELATDRNPTTGRKSEVAKILTATAETITDAMMVSAYDIYHRHIPLPYEVTGPEVFFVDSGGYEVGDVYDYSEVIRSVGVTNEWDIGKYTEVLDKWPEHIPAVFVSCDHNCKGKTVLKQIEYARKLFAKYRRHQLCTLLIKPVSDELTFNRTLKEVCSNIDEMRYFDIFALAEKDLGNSVLLVMENIAKIRIAMDEARINIPIHLFGSLDPLTSCLYFLAGAEIFDGLTWLRYAYFEGKSIYYRNHGILSWGLNQRDDLVRAHNINNNLYHLQNLRQEMMEYLLDKDFSKFSYNGEILRKGFDALRTRLEGRNI